MNWKQRYTDAHREWFKRKYPLAWNDGHYSGPVMPKYKTANGLTNLICSYLKWVNCIGNRINTMGRQVNGKWIPSTTKKGTADITAILPGGRTIYIEVKVGKDRPRPEQLAMQKQIRELGGVYEFISTPEQFFELLDSLLK